MKLSVEQANILDKIVEKSRMDCWFSITEDLTSIHDVETNRNISLRYGIGILNQGVTDLVKDYGLNEHEVMVYHDLLISLGLEKEQKKEIETIRERKITVKLSDADCDRLARKCGEHGLTIGELIEKQEAKGRKRNVQINIRISEAEAEQLRKKVEQSGMSQQEYILSCVLNKPITNTDGIKELIPELKRVGNNLNQIAHALNGGRYYQYNLITDNQKELDKVWQSLKQFLQKQA